MQQLLWNKIMALLQQWQHQTSNGNITSNIKWQHQKQENRQFFPLTVSTVVLLLSASQWMAANQGMENQPLLPLGHSSGFWTSNRRQYGVIMIVNLATFLQGASVGTSAISIPRMPTNESALDDTLWPFDFVITDKDAFWIS